MSLVPGIEKALYGTELVEHAMSSVQSEESSWEDHRTSFAPKRKENNGREVEGKGRPKCWFVREEERSEGQRALP